MLSFICGTQESQKLSEIFTRAKADAHDGKSVFILVPEQYSMYAEQELLSALGISAQNKIQILTFSRLSNLVFSKMGPLRTKYLDKAGKFIMTRRALQIAEKDLLFFKRGINRHGFTGLIRNTISEFKRYGVSPSDLSRFSETCEDERLSRKLHDLSLIYENFNVLVENNHSNAEDNLSLIIPRLKDADFLTGTFYITFFKSFTPTEYSVIGEIMSKSDICVALTLDKIRDGSPVFSTQRNTHQKLCTLAEHWGTEVNAPLFLTSVTDNIHPELLHLRNNFFSSSPEAYPEAPQHIHISVPENFHSEVTECARLIKKLIREKNYSLNDILILTGTMENYEFLIPRIFKEHGITYFLDQKQPITDSPFMRMITAVLEILAFGFSYDRIMLLARSGYFPVTLKEADIFENYILAADIPHGQWNSYEEWTYNPDRHKFDLNFINSVKSRLVHPVLDLHQMFSGRKTAKTIHSNLCQWLDKMSIPETVGKKIDRFKEVSDMESAEQLRLVWNSFVSVINQICDFLNQENSTFTEFYEIFTSACGELSVGMIPPTRDKVIISSVDLFRSTGTKAVIVLGALDGTFPRDYETEGLLSDAERIQMNEKGLTLAPDTFSLQQEEQFLIYSVLTTAKEDLYIFSPMGNRDGKSLKPSEIIRTLKKDLFPKLRIESNCADGIANAESRSSAFQNLSVKLFENGWELSALSPLWKTVFDCLENDTEFAPRLAQLQKMSCASSTDKPLSMAIAKKLYGNHPLFSVSKFEKYNSCAFSFFMRYGLYAEERKMGGLQTSDTGTILHSVLCDYFKDKSQKNTDYGSISRDQCFQEISELVNKAGESTNKNLYSSSHHYKYMMLRIKNIATSTAWKLIKFYARSDFRPTGFEISFGENRTYPPYSLSTNHGEVRLEGFIDKIDTAQINEKTHIIVSDYKSSERHLDMALAEAGVHFQPFVYANALTSHLTDAEIAGMFYLQMNDPIINCNVTPADQVLEKAVNEKITAHGKVVNDPEILRSIDHLYDDKKAIHYIKCDKATLMEREIFEKSLMNADKKAAETADNILDGKIDINPVSIKGFDPCQYCPYGTVCQKK